MILVGISWVWIALTAFCIGYAITHLLNTLVKYPKKDPDMIILFGLCFLTVYAQFFSLIYKVGAAASILLGCIVMAILFCMRRMIVEYFRQWIQSIQSQQANRICLYICIALSSILLILTSRYTTHYDTPLYHAQSIRWIEEYGIVPGLGNLHNRIAYNSSAFCLQALFSLRFLFHQSLHSVNGFVTLFLLCYSICSLKTPRHKRFFASDFLRIGLIYFINIPDNYLKTSSPGSDLLALGLVYYILIKWISLWEDGETQEAPYAQLCLLSVFAVSVKLSAAMIVLLTLLPAITLIKKKKWKDILLYIFMGTIIILPFLIRNVIISGYLLYPYPELDLFTVDWKMPSYTLLFDRNEIKVWGQGIKNVGLFNAPLKEWFHVWHNLLNRPTKQMFLFNLPAMVISISYGIYKFFKKEGKYLWMAVTICLCFLLWFIGAPLPRYGSVYLTIMPLLVLGKILSTRKFSQNSSPIVAIIAVAFISYHMYPIINNSLNEGELNWKLCADYSQFECEEHTLGNTIIYVPTASDQAGYYAFPSTPYAARLDLIELRGTDISEGFRMKREYREALVTTYGNIDETNIFSNQ